MSKQLKKIKKKKYWVLDRYENLVIVTNSYDKAMREYEKLAKVGRSFIFNKIEKNVCRSR